MTTTPAPVPAAPLRVLGMISGTSHDGVDACLVEFRWEGTELVGRVEAGETVPYPSDLRARLVAALPPGRLPMAEVCELDTAIGRHFADVAVRVLGGRPVDLVCSHGQTTFHWVQDGRALGTLQLGQPAWVAEAVGAPVLSDVRSADVAAGGQGAPLVSVLDELLLGGRGHAVAALNLGGISNMTVVPAAGSGEQSYAYDLGPANALVDAAVHAATSGAESYDRDGATAARGSVDDALLADLLAEPYYAQPRPKSTGKELFHGDYVTAARGRHPGVGDDDLVATLTELSARVVAAEVTACGVREVVASGGGVRNPVLLQRIRDLLPDVAVTTVDDHGLDSDLKEAAAFALIGFLSAHGLPGNVPSCTGAERPVVLGTLTAAGAAALRTPPPGGPTRVRFS